MSDINGNPIADQLDFKYERQVTYRGRLAHQYMASADVVLTCPAKPKAINPKTGKRVSPIKSKPTSLLLIVSRIYDKQDKLLVTWYLLTNMQDDEVHAGDMSQWYYWRWQIESYFKLLKMQVSI